MDSEQKRVIQQRGRQGGKNTEIIHHLQAELAEERTRRELAEYTLRAIERNVSISMRTNWAADEVYKSILSQIAVHFEAAGKAGE